MARPASGGPISAPAPHTRPSAGIDADEGAAGEAVPTMASMIVQMPTKAPPQTKSSAKMIQGPASSAHGQASAPAADSAARATMRRRRSILSPSQPIGNCRTMAPIIMQDISWVACASRPARRHGVEREEAQPRGLDRRVQRRCRHGDWCKVAWSASRLPLCDRSKAGASILGETMKPTAATRQRSADRIGQETVGAHRGEDQRPQRKAQRERGGVGRHRAGAALLGAERVQPGLGQHEQDLRRCTQQQAQHEP